LKSKEKRTFWLKFIGKPMNIRLCSEPIITTLNGIWDKNSNGERRIIRKQETYTDNKKNEQVRIKYIENVRWCCNPQFYLNLTDQTNFKIVLLKGRERGKKRNIRIGFTMCQPPLKTDDVNIESLPKIKQIEIRQNKMKLDVKPTLVEPLERKMFISPNEELNDYGFLPERNSSVA